MAKIKQKSSNRAKTAHTPARPKTSARSVVRGSHASSSKPSPKVKPLAATKKSVKAATPKKTSAKSAPKPAPKPAARKAVVKKAAAKKVAAAKPAKKAAKSVPVKAVKVIRAQKKTVAPKTAAVKKPVVKQHAKPDTSLTRKPEASRKFVTISKPEPKNLSKGKARVASPPGDNNFTMQDGRYALPATTTIDLPNGYKPSAKEEYMSPAQLQYFRNKLSQWRADLVEESRQTIESLRDEVRDVGDEAERATRETENSLELRTRDRYRKLIAKIDKALKRIEEGHYGFCEETDEDIGIDRLEARPIATLSLDAQERWEHRQKQMGD